MKNGIVTISDANFFEGVVALVNSIKINSPAQITVIDQGLLNNQIEYLHNIGINVIRIHRRIPINTDRFGCCLALFDIDAAPYDNILYIDADCIVLENINNLFDDIFLYKIICSNTNPLRELDKFLHRPNLVRLINRIKKQGKGDFFKKTCYAGIFGYLRQWCYPSLNTGVVGIKKEIFAELAEKIKKYDEIIEDLLYPDQELLSLLLGEMNLKCHILSYEYNATRLHMHPQDSSNQFIKLFKKVDMTIEKSSIVLNKNKNVFGRNLINQKIKILHFNSIDKPWKERAKLRDGIKELWDYYRNYSL